MFFVCKQLVHQLGLLEHGRILREDRALGPGLQGQGGEAPLKPKAF